MRFDALYDTIYGLAADVVRSLFGVGGPAAALMGEVERRGLSDARWRHIPGATFAKLVRIDGTALALYCAPTFVKLRMREGEPLDAKVYLQAGNLPWGTAKQEPKPAIDPGANA